MKIEVVGAGFGRTGTLSFKLALEQLGFGPCYHMLEVFGRPEHVRAWAAAVHGELPDWDTLFADYRSTCDWPACEWWAEIKAANPGAKVVLTRRDPHRWYESMTQTIFVAIERPLPVDDELMAQHMTGVRTMIRGRFDNRLDDEDHVLSVLAAHEQSVIDAVPPEELLVYDVAQGWDPLCAFLGVDVPDTEFPRTNTTDEFRAMLGIEAG